MKRSLLVLIGLLSSVSPSFAMLDDPLKETLDGLGYLHKQGNNAKDLLPKHPDPRYGDPRYEGRSPVNDWYYPKMVMLHPYNAGHHNAPFSAALLHAYSPRAIENYCAQHLSDHEKLYSFVVQSGDAKGLALKPQYLAHPDAPRNFAGRNYNDTSVGWTVVPGGQGQVEPLGGNLEIVGLHSALVYTHHSGDSDGRMGISDTVLSLKGLELGQEQLGKSGGFVYSYLPSKDLYSLVTFEDQGRKMAAITYHWILSPGFIWDYKKARPLILFDRALAGAQTFRELIHNLEPLDKFKHLLGELKKFVGLSQRFNLNPTGYAAHIEQVHGPMTMTTDHSMYASYQAESQRFPVIPGKKIRVPYDIHVEQDGKISLGLLNTERKGWYGNEVVLEAGQHKSFFERFIPHGETETSLVFRNYHLERPGQSIFTINDVQIEKEMDEAAVKLQLVPTTNPINVSHKKLTKVTTDNNANASYQLESDRFSVIPDEKIRVSYEITVEPGGIMSLGLLNTLRAGWYGDEVVLGPGQHANFFERIVPEGETTTSVVFRNYHLGTPGQSIFTIEDVKIEKEGKASGIL